MLTGRVAAADDLDPTAMATTTRDLDPVDYRAPSWSRHTSGAT